MRNLAGIDLKLENLIKYFKANKKIITAYIFGSFGTEKQTAMSDIDIAVLYESDISVMEELKHASEISSILQTDKVDVINLNTAPVYTRHQVLYSGAKIFERSPIQTADFVENVLEEYHDYEFILRKYMEDYEQGLAEEYAND